MVVIVALWLSVRGHDGRFLGSTRSAGLLFVPYLVWVTIAGALNFGLANPLRGLRWLPARIPEAVERG